MRKQNEAKDINMKKAWIGISIMILVIILAAAGILYWYLHTPQYAATKALNGLKNRNVNDVNEYVSYSSILELLTEGIENPTGQSDFEKKCFEDFKYKINSVKTQGDTATINIEGTNKNYRNALNKWIQQVYQKFVAGEDITSEEQRSLLSDCLGDGSIGTMTVTENITLKKESEKWKIVIDDNFENVVFPGLSEVVGSMGLLLNNIDK